MRHYTVWCMQYYFYSKYYCSLFFTLLVYFIIIIFLFYSESIGTHVLSFVYFSGFISVKLHESMLYSNTYSCYSTCLKTLYSFIIIFRWWQVFGNQKFNKYRFWYVDYLLWGKLIATCRLACGSAALLNVLIAISYFAEKTRGLRTTYHRPNIY